jgi:hypothetical protein
MNFKEAIKHITGEKLRDHPKRAEDWMKRFIEAAPAKDKKFLKKWHANQDDLDWFVADFYRIHFNRWKKEEKSRSARISSFRRKPRRPREKVA